MCPFFDNNATIPRKEGGMMSPEPSESYTEKQVKDGGSSR